jgi:ferredoxin
MGYTARIDKNSCQSAGNCVDAAPAAFGFDADGLGDVKPGVSGLERARLVEIARRCPALAITIFDAAGNEIETER